MAEVNLLRRYPGGKRSVQARAHAKTPEHIRISRQYGKEYFDEFLAEIGCRCPACAAPPKRRKKSKRRKSSRR